MRAAIRPVLFLGLSAMTAAAAQNAAAPPGATAPPASTVVGTHHIDRYEAIMEVRKALEADLNNLNDWILLGELAQEFAADTSSEFAPGYYRLATQAYTAASKLAPTNAHLKAAAQFAMDQERDAEQAARAKKATVNRYLETRRREIAKSGSVPTVRVYVAPSPNAPTYQPYYYQPYVSQAGTPYRYQQHVSANYMIGEDGIRIYPRAGQIITATERAALVKPAAEFAPP